MKAIMFHRYGFSADDEGTTNALRPAPGMKPGQLLGCSISLLVAGLLLTRGFIGFNPGRPLFVFLGGLLACSATAGLALDHVAVRSTRERPGEVLAAELNRSRRFGHQLCLVSVACDPHVSDRLIRRLRGSDRAWRRNHLLWVLLTETDPAGLDGFLVRSEDLIGGSKVEAAVFPDDAVTAEGLVAALKPVGARGAAVLRLHSTREGA